MSTLTAPLDEVHEMVVAAVGQIRQHADRARAEVEAWEPAPMPEGWS